jgi:peroxiredoxin (alkyl hydroperoxide reductase subunit C)
MILIKRRNSMLTVGDKIDRFVVTGVNPGSDQFFDITEASFEGKWKIIVYYPRTLLSYVLQKS